MRDGKSIPVDANSTRERRRKTIDKMVMRFFGPNVEILYDLLGRRIYVINGKIIAQFNTSEDVKKKRDIIKKLMESENDGKEV